MVIIKHKAAKSVLLEILGRLQEIEVKGDSVEYLYIAKLGVKQILDSLDELPDKNVKAESQDEKKEG